MRYRAMIFFWSPYQIETAQSFHEALNRNLLEMYEAAEKESKRPVRNYLARGYNKTKEIVDKSLTQQVRKIVRDTKEKHTKSAKPGFTSGHRGGAPVSVILPAKPDPIPDDERIRQLKELCGDKRNKQSLEELIEAVTRMFVCSWEFAINRTIKKGQHTGFAEECAERALKFILSDAQRKITATDLFEGIIKCKSPLINNKIEQKQEDSKVRNYTIEGICQNAPFVTPDGSNNTDGTFYIPEYELFGKRSNLIIGIRVFSPKGKKWENVIVEGLIYDATVLDLARVETRYPPIQISEAMRKKIARPEEVEFEPVANVKELFKQWFRNERLLKLLGAEQVAEYIRDANTRQTAGTFSMNDWANKRQEREPNSQGRQASHPRGQAVYHGQIGESEGETIDLQHCNFANSDLSGVRITNATPSRSFEGTFLYQADISFQQQQSISINFKGAVMTECTIQIIGKGNCDLDLAKAKTAQMVVNEKTGNGNIRLNGEYDGEIRIDPNVLPTRVSGIRTTSNKVLMALTLVVILMELSQKNSSPPSHLMWGALLLVYCVTAITTYCAEQRTTPSQEESHSRLQLHR